MPAKSSNLAVPQTYAALRRAVEDAMVKGQQAVEQARVRTYWETGRLIDGHLLAHEEQAGYGTQTLRRLAADLRLEERIIYRCLQFARAYPKLSARTKLSWAYYRLLMQLPEPARRTALEKEAVRQNWTSLQLEERVRALVAADSPSASAASPADDPPRLLKPKRGTPGVCRIAANDTGLAADVGFAVFLDLTEKEARRLQAVDFVQITEAGVMPAAAATKADLFTYAASLLKVVDGDTLWVRIGLGRGFAAKHKLRLRDLDCPEMSTTGGKAAKRFVDSLAARLKTMTICTTKPDKYDRYLADVFLALDDGTEVFLNNALLENGHATSKKEWQFSDWGE